MSEKWYSLHVQSGFETMVKANIQRELDEEKLSDRVTEIFIPAVEKVVFKVSGKEKEAIPLKGENRVLEIVGNEGKKVVFKVENGKVWVDSCECKKKCIPEKAISRVGQSIKCPGNKVEAKIMLRDKLYPGYIFIKAQLDKRTQSVINSIPRVLGFINAAGEPIEVSDSEVTAILERLKKGVPKLLKAKYSVGEKVKIKEGPFIGFEGTVKEVDVERHRVIVFVNIFDRQTPVELEFDQVEKVS